MSKEELQAKLAKKPTQRTKVWWFTLNTSKKKRSVCAPTS